METFIQLRLAPVGLAVYLLCICSPVLAVDGTVHQPEPPKSCLSAFMQKMADASRVNTEVIGLPPFPAQLRRAINHVLQKNYGLATGTALTEKRAYDLEDLLRVIRRSANENPQNGVFNYSRTLGSDQSVVFSGPDPAHSLVIAPDGRIFYGGIRPKLFGSEREWPADYSGLREVHAD